MNAAWASARRGRKISFLALIAAALVIAACVQTPPAGLAPTAPAATLAPTEPPATPAPTEPAAPPTEAAAQPETDVTTAEIPSGVDADGNFTRGNPDAPVVLVEWSDFECPYCGRHAVETAPQLDEQYVATGRVLHVFRNLPLSFHPEALPAAQAAYCAGQQDPALFWKMHDWLFANQAIWTGTEDAAAQFRDQAIALKVDADAFDACLVAPETQAVLDRDLAEASALQIAGTPSFYVNDWFLGGAYPIEAFQDVISRAEQGIHPAPTPTPLPEGVAPYDPNPDKPGFTYDGSPARGEADARLVLIAFTDFNCADCVKFQNEDLPALDSKYIEDGQMRYVHKIFATGAPNAAAASLCALEGGKFWEFADLLYKEDGNWTDGDTVKMLEYARQVGLDETEFEACESEGRYHAQVENESALAQQLGFQVAPAFVLIDTQANAGLPIQGSLNPEKWDEAIGNVLNPPTPTPTVTPAP